MDHADLIQSCERFLKLWHENARHEFNRSFKQVNPEGFAKYPDTYDRCNAKALHDRRDWICLDSGGSGVYMVRKADAQVFNIKAYGRPHLRKPCGYIGDLITKLALANVDQETVEIRMLA